MITSARGGGQPTDGRHGSTWWRNLLPPAPLLLRAALATLAGVLPAVPLGVFAGVGMAVVALVATIAATGFATVTGPAASVALVGIIAAAAAAGAAVARNPLGGALVVGAAALLCVPADRRSLGLLRFAPILAAVTACVPLRLDPARAAVAAAIGGGYALVLLWALRAPRRPPRPVPARLAWSYGLVLAVLAGLVTGLSVAGRWPRGYWLVFALVGIFQPTPALLDTAGADSRRGPAALLRSVATRRAVGTLAGGAIAAGLVLVLPAAGRFVLAAVAAALQLAYRMAGRVIAQITLLTAAIVLLVSSGHGAGALAAALERIGWTFAALLLTLVASIGLDWITGPRARPPAGEPPAAEPPDHEPSGARSR